MRNAWVASVWLAALGLAADLPLVQAQSGGDAAGASGKFTLTSPDIAPGRRIPDTHVYNEHGCTGQNISPALAWSNPPSGTQSFALLMHDPDAPTGHGWWHWIIYNIPASVTSLPADAGDPKKNLVPGGVLQGRSDSGPTGYAGPCPPPGASHHYHFRLYALKVRALAVPQDASPATVRSAVEANALANTELVALYGR